MCLRFGFPGGRLGPPGIVLYPFFTKIETVTIALRDWGRNLFMVNFRKISKKQKGPDR